MKRLGATVLVGLIVISACANPAEPLDNVAPLDREAVDGDFEKNAVITAPELQDVTSPSLQADAIQKGLFEKSPYKKRSFLASYRSNGLPASEAVVRAGLAHRVNPLVLLVRAEMEQGLVASGAYPDHPERVEFVFGCGCPGVGNCNPAMAGFDRQVDCLARSIRAQLDALAGEKKTTTGGWAPGKEQMTLDGELVTPQDEGTAVIYELSPIVGQSKRGAWLFHNIFRLYGDYLGYAGPIGTGDGQSWIGDPCQDNRSCTSQTFQCARDVQIPGGMCTLACSPTEPCPNEAGRAATACIAFSATAGYCLAQCDPAGVDACRQGFDCKPGAVFGGKVGDTKSVCVWKI